MESCTPRPNHSRGGCSWWSIGTRASRREFPPTSRRKGRFRAREQEGFHLPCDSRFKRPRELQAASSILSFMQHARSLVIVGVVASPGESLPPLLSSSSSASIVLWPEPPSLLPAARPLLGPRERVHLATWKIASRRGNPTPPSGVLVHHGGLCCRGGGAAGRGVVQRAMFRCW